VSVLKLVRSGEPTDDIIEALTADEQGSMYGFGASVCESEGVLARHVLESLSKAIFRKLLVSAPRRASAIRFSLRRILDARQSNMAERDVWIDKLGLPADALDALS
jgi:hypothetical protein